jgi:hypothetical protein
MSSRQWHSIPGFGTEGNFPRVQPYGDKSGAAVVMAFSAKFTPTNPAAAISADVQAEVDADPQVIAARQLAEQRKSKVSSLQQLVASREKRVAGLEQERKDPALLEMDDAEELVTAVGKIDDELRATKTALEAGRPALALAQQHATQAQAALDGAIAVAQAAAVKKRLGDAQQRKAVAESKLAAAVAPVLDALVDADAEVQALQALARVHPEPEPLTKTVQSLSPGQAVSTTITRTLPKSPDFARV